MLVILHAVEQPKLKDDDEEYRDKFWPADPPTPHEVDYENLQNFCDKVDVIIQVVNENEFRAAVRHMDPPCSPYERPVENFPEAPFIIGVFAKKKAALVQTDQGARCREDIENAVTVFKNAQCILLVGVGYAFDRKYKLGDVLVSNSISDMMVWKFTKEGEVQDRGQTIDVERFLRNIFCRNISLKKPFVVSTSGRESKVHCGQFVSFSALMDNEYERNKFHEARDYAIGGEMEGGVVREVSKKKDNNIKGIIIIKGVADYADDTKEKDWQFTTAMAAFNYTKSKLETVTLSNSSASGPSVRQQSSEEAHASDSGGFTTPKQAKFPYLNIKELSPDQQHHLIGRLEMESEDMHQEFVYLVSKTSQSLETNNVKPKDVILILNGYDIPGLSQDMTISTALSKIYKHCTFFNYQIIATIINRLGGDQDKDMLDEYKAKFKKYCKRRVYEVPIDVLKCCNKEPKTELRIKTDKNFDIPVENIHCIGSRLSSLLGVKLLLLKTEEGCIELFFDCFESKCLEPLENSDLSTFITLKELGITKIYTESHVYYEQVSEKPAQKSSLLHSHDHTGKVDRSLTTQTATPPSPEMSSAFSRFRNYLKSYYNTNPVARDDKLSIAPCSEFISLALVKKDKSLSKDDAFSRSTFYGGRDQISAHKVPLELDGILASESKFILVEGAPGIGKSTLSWELCRKWDTLKCLQHYSIVLLLKLREGRVQNASSLNELFYHRNRMLRKSVAHEVDRCEGEGVLLILDGFDEMPASVVRNKESLIMEIVSGTCIPRATRLVTSRPSALHHTKCFPREFRHVEIVGFTDVNVKKYAERAFDSEPKVLSEFKKFVFSNPIIKSLMYIPVNCAILARSYKDIMRSRKQVPKTTTQLYSMLTPVLIRRHLIATGRWDEYSEVPSDLKDLPEDVKGDLERVSKLAYTGLFKEDVQLVFTDSDVGEGFHPLGLLSEVKEMYVCVGIRTSYSFLHLSIQEFLAAWHVSCHQELVEEALAKALRKDSAHLHVFGRMLAGLTGISDLYIEYLMEWPGGELYACHCLYEAQNKSSNFFDNFDHGVHLSTPLDTYVFGYCLTYFAYQWPFVSIDSSVDMLVSSLADHASNEVLGSIETLELTSGSSSSTHKLKDLPHSLLYSIKKIAVLDIPLFPLLEGMPVLPCVQEFFIKVLLAEHSWSIIKKFPNLKVLSIDAEVSERRTKCELTKAITSSSNMEFITLYSNPSHNNYCEYRLDSLAQAALSCPSLKRLDTNYPFVISNNTSPKNIQNIEVFTIEWLLATELPRLFDYLYSIASVCKVSPVQSIKYSIKDSELNPCSISLSSLPCDCVGGYYDYISLLNVCLHHHWPSMKKLILPFAIPCTQFHLSSLSRALRRDPDTSQLKLRRSKSLSDLVCLKTLDEHARKHCITTNPTLRDIGNHIAVVKKTESCPDLVGIQSLHPLMAEKLFEGSEKLSIEVYSVCSDSSVSSDDSSVCSDGSSVSSDSSVSIFHNIWI